MEFEGFLSISSKAFNNKPVDNGILLQQWIFLWKVISGIHLFPKIPTQIFDDNDDGYISICIYKKHGDAFPKASNKKRFTYEKSHILIGYVSAAPYQ